MGIARQTIHTSEHIITCPFTVKEEACTKIVGVVEIYTALI